MVPDPAPWWGVPVIAGGFLILGGALTFVYNYLQDKRRAKIEDARRFEADIRRLHRDIVEAVHVMFSAKTQSEPRPTIVAEFDSQIDTISRALIELDIIADNGITSCVRDLLGITEDIRARLARRGKVDDLRPLRTALDHAVHRLVMQMRQSLRIPDDVKVDSRL